MLSFKDAAATAIRGALCASLAAIEDSNRLLNRILRTPGLDYFNVSGALRAQICNIDPDDANPNPGPPFTGGQCPEPYIITFRRINLDGSLGPNIVRRTRGPIAGARRIQLNENDPPLYSLQIGSHSQLVNSSVCSSQSDQGFAWRQFGSGVGEDVEFLSASPCGANNCGDPPIVLPEPGPVERPITVIYDIDESTNIEVNGTVVIAPFYIGFDGSINAPITLDLGGFEWSGDIKIAPEFEVNLFPDGIINIPGDVDGTEQPFPDDPDDPVDPVEEESDPTIIGVEVFCQVNTAQAASSINFPNAPNIYVPRLGDVSFGIRTRTSVVWTSDIPIKNREAYIPNPAPQGAVSVRVRPQPGVTIKFNPVRERPLLDLTLDGILD